MTNATTFALNDTRRVDLATLIETRLLIQANSGGGKSHALRRVLEQTHGRVQHLVIDVEGEFASLRESFDYIHAAKGGDVGVSPRTAPLLAERLLELGASAILDIYELKHDERVAFVDAFVTALVNAPKSLWHPVLVVIDEAHVFAPQGERKTSSCQAVIDLATRGRKRGFCLVAATQRLSKLHKDVAAELNNKLIGRTGLDVDIARAGDELGMSKADRLILRTLRPGAFYSYGPALGDGVDVLQIGPVTTSHPKAGGHRDFTPPPPTDKVRAVLAKLADIPEEQERRDRTVADLEAEVSQLRRQVAARPKSEAAPLLTDAEAELLEHVGESMRQYVEYSKRQADMIVDRMREAFEAFNGALNERAQRAEANLSMILNDVAFRTVIAKLPNSALRPESGWLTTREQPRSPAVRGIIADERATTSALPPGETAVLTAALQYPGIDRNRLSVLTGYKRSSRDAYIARLAKQGLIVVSGSTLTATDAGRAALPTFEPLPTGQALIEYWRQRLPEGERNVFDVLVAGRGRDVQRGAIDTHTGYKRSSRDAYLVRLKARGIVETSSGAARAARVLFQ